MKKSLIRRLLLPFAASALTVLGTGASSTPATAQTNSPVTIAQTLPGGIEVPMWAYVIGGTVLILVFLPKVGWVLGLIVIGEREVGIITKKFSKKSLPPGQMIALNGEAGLQADTLPPGWHFGYFPWQFSVRKEPVIVVPQDEIGLIVANDGRAISPERILGKVVDSDNFQDARKFLTNSGEKGRQMAVLTTGTYRINTALFEVILSSNADVHGMSPNQLRVFSIAPDRVGIVTTLDGAPIEEGAIAGPVISNHDNFQNAQVFINSSGSRGLQEQVMLSGSWNLNPWFVRVEETPMTEVPIGYVGVVISYVGRSDTDVTGDAFAHGSLVKKGDRGVWIEPLNPGKHPLNTKIMKVELVPTTNIVLNFTARYSGEHGYDAKLTALQLLSSDGFTYETEVFQIIHVGSIDAPKVISRLGSMQNLVDHVLRPIVGNYFRNSAQEYTILDFLIARGDRQAEAAEYVRQALRAYDVQAVDTLIGLITPPKELMQTLTERKIAEEQQKTYEVQRLAEAQRQELVRETALANIQKEVVTAEQGVNIAELRASATVKQASGEAEAIRLTGEAKADAYQAGVKSLGAQAYTALQLMQVIGDRQVRVVPDVSVSGGGNGSGLMDGLMGMLMLKQSQELQNGHSEPVKPVNGKPAELTNLSESSNGDDLPPPPEPPATPTRSLVIKDGIDAINLDQLFEQSNQSK
jgi:uncharacterized membrane protein YqiK